MIDCRKEYRSCKLSRLNRHLLGESEKDGYIEGRCSCFLVYVSHLVELAEALPPQGSKAQKLDYEPHSAHGGMTLQHPH